MTATQLRAMQAGRDRARRERERDARDRVAAFRRWLKAGCPTTGVPVIPSDADYRMVRNGR